MMRESERMRILELLEQGRLTTAEAAELLSALDEPVATGGRREGPAQARDRSRWFRVRVTDNVSGRTRANVSIPIGMVGFGLGMAQRLHVPAGGALDEILDAVRSGRRGTVFDVSSGDDGERVEIITE